MGTVLILYATREGQTEKIAVRIGDHLTQAGARVRIINAKDKAVTQSLNLEIFDLLVFGASMHAGGLEPELVAFVNRHSAEIELKNRSFFLVLLSAATQDPVLKAEWLKDACTKMRQQLQVSFPKVEMIAGALMYSKYPLPLKWLMKQIAQQAGEGTDLSQDYEYTDWQQVQQYAQALIKA
ncbi:flavodoxin domain-containing protein [Lyngbya confervoides]|uniref:Flavodoxin domain-containing protein n=1 Tax=Lyngbya confervoides BDU141951 TaxID=1574623 RepID=A0ABD4T637_9CYAN|nr:flavodoxin domain-containing protein [Lyngbya confervoides]MCM1984231.1 flavodoxin domain-containing protein [Lyngbya confervoides BDU141951]